jgi:hypothetical protein
MGNLSGGVRERDKWSGSGGGRNDFFYAKDNPDAGMTASEGHGSIAGGAKLHSMTPFGTEPSFLVAGPTRIADCHVCVGLASWWHGAVRGVVELWSLAPEPNKKIIL